MTHHPWKVVISVWRSIGEAFLRLPLLAAGSAMLYVFLYAYWLHGLPFDIPRGWAQIPYALLHAVIFAPLSFGIIQMVIRGDVRHPDVWKAGAISVGLVIVAHEWGVLALRAFVHTAGTGPLYALMWRDPAHGMLVATLLATLNLVVLAVTVLLPLRLALLLPIAALRERGWKTMLSDAWRDMRGHYGFTVAVSIAALFPVVVADYFLQKLYRNLHMPHGVAAGSPWEQWSAFFVWSVNLELGYIATAALTAWLYRAIETRRSTVPIKGQDSLSSNGADAPFSPGMKAQ